MSKSKEYIVIRQGVCVKGTQELELNTVVKLTDVKAAALSGKVQLVKEFNKNNESTDLEKENKELKKQLEKLTAQLVK